MAPQRLDWTPPGGGAFNGWLGTDLTKESALTPFCFSTDSQGLDNKASSIVAISAAAFLVVVVVVVEVSSRLCLLGTREG
jgi:hypothetical protein